MFSGEHCLTTVRRSWVWAIPSSVASLFPNVCPNCLLSSVSSRCSSRIEATVMQRYCSQGPGVCVTCLFSQLIPWWADNGICPLPPEHHNFFCSSQTQRASLDVASFIHITYLHSKWLSDYLPVCQTYMSSLSQLMLRLSVWIPIILFFQDCYSATHNNKYATSCLPVDKLMRAVLDPC